jgi:hypothetical protein
VPYASADRLPDLLRPVRLVGAGGDAGAAEVVLGPSLVGGGRGDDFGCYEEPGTGNDSPVDGIADIAVGLLHTL